MDSSILSALITGGFAAIASINGLSHSYTQWEANWGTNDGQNLFPKICQRTMPENI